MMIDAEIIKRLNGREIAAFEALYDKYAPCLLGIIKKNIPDFDDACQILNDCFIKIWKDIHLYDEREGSFFSWMLRIAIRLCVQSAKGEFIMPFTKIKSD